MGILNMTPDSFSDGGANSGVADAVAAARRMVAEVRGKGKSGSGLVEVRCLVIITQLLSIPPMVGRVGT